MKDAYTFPMHLALAVAAGASGTLSQQVPFDGRVSKIILQLYKGNQMALQLVPVVIRRATHYPLLMFAQGGKQYIDGDSLFLALNVDYLLQHGVDRIGVEYDNTDATYEYAFAVDISVVKGTA